MERALEEQVWARAGGVCEYCGMAPALDPLPFCIDHVIAQKHRGETAAENLALACYNWNVQALRLFNPRLDVWTEHFRLENGRIIPLTPVGRVTEYLLQLNQPQTVRERQWLIEAGRYPRDPVPGKDPFGTIERLRSSFRSTGFGTRLRKARVGQLVGGAQHETRVPCVGHCGGRLLVRRG